ncbi:MAG: outer membrane lipoprotein carrier protein LolA [Bryobacterales bacterium]|nr:outer membrane lipoprotein carrier protein LolA [Bryobacterales bacterium]
MEEHYNRAQTLTVGFEQRNLIHGTPRRVETGTLTLRKPGRMRWDYAEPAGKFFLCDGKQVYFYSPAANRVERSPLKESGDFRAPMAFLLGKLNFRKEFADLSLREEDGRGIVTGLPKSDRVPYSKVEFTITEQYRISKLVITNQDQTVTEIQFRNERSNVAAPDGLFRFSKPPAAELVDVEQ